MRSAGQLGREGEARPHQLVAQDHEEGVQPRAPSICEESTEAGRQSFPIYSACSSPSIT